MHPGADDNASGVAVLLEVARAMADAGASRRTIVFVATTAEEAGMLGSKHYVEHPVRPREGIRSVLNIDSVGRLGTAPLGVIGSATATEWPHVFRGIGFVTGIQTQFASQGLESSDQASFIARGIPAVQLFTPPHTDYHRPGDTADKVDVAGLVRVATVAREAVTYLADRPEPLTITIAAPGAQTPTAAAPGPQGARRAGFGIVPDFAFAGPRRQGLGTGAGIARRAGGHAGGRRAPRDGRQGARVAVGVLGRPQDAGARPVGADRLRARRHTAHGDGDVDGTVTNAERRTLTRTRIGNVERRIERATGLGRAEHGHAARHSRGIPAFRGGSAPGEPIYFARWRRSS